MLESRLNKALQSLQQTQGGPVRPASSPESSSGASKCRPLSLEDFNARLSTFGNATNWFAKPACISPAVCARFGWRSAGVDLLECSACNAALSFRTPAVTAQSTVEQLAAQWALQLGSSGHKPYCPWRDNPSPEAFTTCFPHGIPQRASVADDLVARWSSLVNHIAPGDLPQLSPAFWSAQLVTQAWLSRPTIMQRLTEVAVSVVASRGPNAAAYTARWRDYAALALFGWSHQVQPTGEGGLQSAPLYVHCNMCCRDVGLWNFMAAANATAAAASAVGSNTSGTSVAAITPPPPTPRPSLHSSVADLPTGNELRASRDSFATPFMAHVVGSLSASALGIASPVEGAATPPLASNPLRSSTAVLATKRPAPPSGEQSGDDAGAQEDHGDSVIKKLRHARTELNPAKEHRWFCPWIAGSPPGWQQLLQLLDATDAPATQASTEQAAEHGLLAMVNIGPAATSHPRATS